MLQASRTKPINTMLSSGAQNSMMSLASNSKTVPSVPLDVPLTIETSIEYEIDKKLFPGLDLNKGKNHEPALIIDPSYIKEIQQQQALQQHLQQMKMMPTRRSSSRSNRMVHHSPGKPNNLHASPLKSPRHSRRLAARRYVSSDTIQKMYTGGDKNMYNAQVSGLFTSGDRLNSVDRSPLGGTTVPRHTNLNSSATNSSLCVRHPQANLTRFTDETLNQPRIEVHPSQMIVSDSYKEQQAMITRSHQRTLSQISQTHSEPSNDLKQASNKSYTSQNNNDIAMIDTYRIQEKMNAEAMAVEQTLPAAPPGCKCPKCCQATEQTPLEYQQQLQNSYIHQQHIRQMQQEHEKMLRQKDQMTKRRLQQNYKIIKKKQQHAQQRFARKQDQEAIEKQQPSCQQFSSNDISASVVPTSSQIPQDNCVFAVPLPMFNQHHRKVTHPCNCLSCLKKAHNMPATYEDHVRSQSVSSLTAYLGAGTPPCDCQNCRVSRDKMERNFSNVMVPNHHQQNVAVNRSPQIATTAFVASNYPPYRPMVSSTEREQQLTSVPHAHAWTSLTPPRDNPMTSRPDDITHLSTDTRGFSRNMFHEYGIQKISCI